MRCLACLLTACLSVTAGAAESSFRYDRHRAVELAVARVRTDSQKYPQAALPGVDDDHPFVVSHIGPRTPVALLGVCP